MFVPAVARFRTYEPPAVCWFVPSTIKRNVSAAASVVAPLTDTVLLAPPEVVIKALAPCDMYTLVPVTRVTLIAVPSPVSVVTYEVLVVVPDVSDRAPTSVTHTQTEPL